MSSKKSPRALARQRARRRSRHRVALVFVTRFGAVWCSARALSLMKTIALAAINVVALLLLRR